MMRDIKSFIRNKRGTAAIEFGAVGGLLALTMLSVVDIGRLALCIMQTNYGVETGTLYAANNGFDVTAISQVVQSAAKSNGITATPSPYMFCGCPIDSGVQEMSRTTTASSCSSATCTNAGGMTAQGAYVKVQAQSSFSALFNVMPYPRDITAAAVVRIQ